MPIAEPEIRIEGDHPHGRCAEARRTVLKAVFAAVAEHRVSLGGLLLKTAMVLPAPHRGGSFPAGRSRSTRRAAPAAVSRILFLSGGQSPAEATARPGAIHRAGNGPRPLADSFGRARPAAARESGQAVGLVPIATSPRKR